MRAAVLLLFIALICGINGSAANYLQAPQSSGGSEADKEYLYESPLKFSSGIGGFTMVVFESVNNVNQGPNWGAYRFYQAPLGAFILPKELPADDLKNGFFRYSVKMIAYHQLMEYNACKSVMEMYKQKSGGLFTCEVGSGMISRMTHRLVTIEFPDFPRAKASHFCSMEDECTFNDEQQVSVIVPSEDKDRFEDYFLNGKLLININLFYKSKDVAVSSISWSASDIQNTSSYKDVVSGGSNFVSATQIQTIIQQAASKVIAIFQDPSVPDKLNQLAFDMFTKYLDIQGMNSDFISTRAQANAIDQQLLAGTGLTAQQFAPITIMWDVVEQVSNSTSWSDANNQINQYFNEDTNREKLEGSASVGFGPFGASMGYSKEMTSDNIKSGYFQNQNEYDSFKSYFSNAHGMQPRITPRGLKLIEKQTFVSNLQYMANAIVYFPMDVAKQVQLLSGVIASSEIHGIPQPPPPPPPPKTYLVESGSNMQFAVTANNWQMIPDLYIDFEVQNPSSVFLFTSSLRYTLPTAIGVTHSIKITKDNGEVFYGDCGSWDGNTVIMDSCAMTTAIANPGKYRVFVAVYPTASLTLGIQYHRHLAAIQES